MDTTVNYGILRNGQLIPATALEWERWWFTKPDERIIGHSWIGEAELLTVCLGIMPPSTSFRTDVFGGPLNGISEQYDTLEEAMLGHERLFGHVESAWERAIGA